MSTDSVSIPAAKPPRLSKTGRQRKIVAPKTSAAREMDKALNSVRGTLFQAMGIVRMATETIRGGSAYPRADTDAWTALEGAHEILSRIADRLETSETMLADEVPHGEY
jgi:hypothetical protein